MKFETCQSRNGPLLLFSVGTPNMFHSPSIVSWWRCNLSVDAAFNVLFTTNRKCAENNTHILMERTSNNRVIMACNFYCYLLPQCEAFRTSRSGFSIATKSSCLNFIWSAYRSTSCHTTRCICNVLLILSGRQMWSGVTCFRDFILFFCAHKFPYYLIP